MFRWVNSSPVLFAQPLEIKNRQRFRRFKSIAEKMSNFLSDRSMLALRSSLELPVKRVGKVLDVQNCHRVTPKLLHNGGTISEASRPLLASKNLHKVCDVVPATSESLRFVSVLEETAKATTTLDLYSQAIDESELAAQRDVQGLLQRA
jgi:hypothetical protein